MEVGKRNRSAQVRAASTRVYAPKLGATAYAYAQPAPAPAPERPKQAPNHTPRPAVKTGPKAKKTPLTLGFKVASVLCVLLMGVSALTVIAGYENIASEYALVNTLKGDIKDAELRLAELNVDLECAVCIEQAKEAAVRLGMTYPTASQYVRAGEALPVTQTASMADTGIPVE